MSRRLVCIVGAPRCGTTSLSLYLREHPGVTFSAVKEPHFFSGHDLTGLCDDALRSFVQADYLQRYFAEMPEDRPWLAEASVSYLYAPERMEAILRLWPDARFIIAVRDPLEMLPSLHQRLLFTGDENQTEFERAWSLCPQRREGKQVPRGCIDRRFLLYDEIGRLGSHVARFLRTVGPERCFIAFYDDLVANPRDLYRDILDFLDLPDDGRTDFAVRRASRGYRLGWLQRLLKRPPKVTRMLLAGEKFRRRIEPVDSQWRPRPAMARLIWYTRKRLLDWNSKPAARVVPSPALQRSIRALLSDEIALLSRLTGRNLDHWLDDARATKGRDKTRPWPDPLRDAA